MSAGFLVQAKGSRVVLELSDERGKFLGKLDLDVNDARRVARLLSRAANRAENPLFKEDKSDEG